MNRQQTAQEMLDQWQARRHLPPRERFSDIGNMTHGILDNAVDLFEIWMQRPQRRHEFGAPEREDIREAVKRLSDLLMEMEGSSACSPLSLLSSNQMD